MSDVLENKDSLADQHEDHGADTFQLVLVKAEHRYCFRYEVGFEQQLIEAISHMANDPTNDLSAKDAWVLSHQIQRNRAGSTEQEEMIKDNDIQM